MDRLELAQKEAELLEAGIPYAAVTMVESAGTARTEGKMLVLSENVIYGTIGGGCSEHSALMEAYRLIGTTQSRCVHVDMSSDVAEEEGMVCGGQMKVLIQGIGG